MIRRRPIGGFTLVEVMLVAGLMSFLMLLMSSSWTAFGRSLSDSITRCRIAQEANLCAESLRRELNGYLPEGTTGTKAEASVVGRLIVSGSQLQVCFDGTPANGVADWAAPDTVCIFEAVGGQLTRTNQDTGEVFVIATGVTQIQFTDLSDGIQIALTLAYRNLTRTFTIVTRDP